MLEELRLLLESIPGFKNKVAYRSFPVGEAPRLPFICYLETGTDNFYADDKVLYSSSVVDIEFYSKNRDTRNEKLIEEKLNSKNITWTKEIEYLDDEKCYEVIYTVEV